MANSISGPGDAERTSQENEAHVPSMRDARAYLAAIVESSDDAILSKDLDGIIRSCNAAAERLFGYAASELIGRPVRTLIPHDRQGEEDEILARLRRGDRVHHFQTVRLTKDGRLVDVSLTISPVRDESGVIIGASKIVRDITAQKRAQATEAYLAAIVQSSDDAIISKDLNGIIQTCNAAAERIFEYSAAELIGRPVRMLIPADRRQEEEQILARVRRGQRVDHFETVRVTKTGRLIDVSLTVSAVRDASGTIIGASKVARDVTEQKRTAAALAAEQAWFRVTLGSIGDAVIATDMLGQIVYMNPVAEYLTGWQSTAAAGRPCADVFDIVNETTGQPVENPVSLVLAQGNVVGLANHTLLIAADGTRRPIDDSGAPIRGHDGRIVGVVLVFRDVSERRRIEIDRQAHIVERERLLEAERAARADAERASRGKDDFVAMVSHELRTPLNAILGWTQLMSKERSDPEVIDRGLEVVARNTRLQAQLVSDLLDISRIVVGKLRLDVQNVDLRDIVVDAVETVEQEVTSKRIQMETDVAADRSVPVAGDPARLQQVVWNLLSNAVKFTPPGGHIRVSLGTAGPNAEIVVADDGRGIAAEFLPYVFDRFHQADRSITRRFGGLGLGLSIVKHLVELHGGAVRVDSDGEGHGTRFTVSLPSSTSPHDTLAGSLPQPAAGEPGIPEVNVATLDGIYVLVVEDEPDTLEFLSQLLRGYGASVVSATSARDALTVFRESPVDVIVSDIGLPSMDGYDLMQRIRRESGTQRRVAAIALTAYARAEDRTRALRAGYQAHMAKPIESAELIATIASLVELTDSRRDRLPQKS